MELETLILITLLGMLGAIFMGVHIALALGATAMFGTFLIFGDWSLAASQVGGAAYSLIRDHVFMTIPLFVLMGDFLSKSGAAADLYNLINKGLKGVPGRLGVATVSGNAAFAAVTGTSIASAAAFTRIAWPEMKRAGYKPSFALGSIAGSACLGMLIPPSVLLIVWGITTEDSIGKLFVAGVIPGIILSLFFVMYIMVTAKLNKNIAPEPEAMGDTVPLTATEIWSGLSIVGLIFLVLGGIWGGIFTATEAAGIGALSGLLIAFVKGMRWKGIVDCVMGAGKTSAPIMILLIAAGMYSRFLNLADVNTFILDAMNSVGINPYMLLVMMVIIWLLLGMLLDSISIILLTVPLFMSLNTVMDPYAFAIFGILAIEAGLLTPPFGLIVYTVKGVLAGENDNAALSTIFYGSIPYWLLMLVVMILIAVNPSVASWLTNYI
ncbi:TRAP transporter large permease [Alphaproteobacteria bacterium]|nr:TRAP transporter large permease [Alphaproteobacteria bacterium]MBT5799031.1 TRAP transporter large permease [Alphaproteobacteria bacterium]MDA9816182.1 TRAP transporter large permease [Alphaproteobacteria bacterium]MDC3311527.1 TRAP transporter large permease [Alphaproteobacteria bacterium]